MITNVKECKYLNFRSGGVVEGHIVKFNISLDPVQLIPSLG